MPTTRRFLVRTPNSWVTAFVNHGMVPDVTDDPAGWHELDRWLLGRAAVGLPSSDSPEGQALLSRAMAKGWTPLR